MDMYKINECVHITVFGSLLISGVLIGIASTGVFVDAFFLLRKEFTGALSKRFWGSSSSSSSKNSKNSKKAIDGHETITTTCSKYYYSNKRKLNVFQIINHIYWYHILAETGRCFVLAMVPKEYYPDLDSYERTSPMRTPLLIKHLLNNPSETAADFAETFTRRLLSNLGFHYLSSNNCNLTYKDGYDPRVDFFEEALTNSCFTRELFKRFNSNYWRIAAGFPPPPPETKFTKFEERVLMRFAYYKPEDDEWIEPLNNWFNWYIKTIHERIFPSQDYQMFEAFVKYLLFSFLHDYSVPWTSFLALFGITDV